MILLVLCLQNSSSIKHKQQKILTTELHTRHTYKYTFVTWAKIQGRFGGLSPSPQIEKKHFAGR